MDKFIKNEKGEADREMTNSTGWKIRKNYWKEYKCLFLFRRNR